ALGEQVVRTLALQAFAIHSLAVPQISPFVGLLFDRSRVGPLEGVTTPPYDTISPEEQRRYLQASPHNVIRLDLGEDRPADDGTRNKYRRASEQLRAWRAQGILVETPRPAYFPYEMRFTLHGRHRRIRGLIGAVELEDWGRSIVPHERTAQGPVEDRLRLVRELRANLSCIHAVFFEPSPPLAALLERVGRTEPLAEAMDEEGVIHRLWMADDDEGVGKSLAGETVLIADGHHRYAMALAYRDEMRAAQGPGPWDRTMMLLMDAAAEDPPVLPYHRIVRAAAPPMDGTPVRDLQEVLDQVDDEGLVFGVATMEHGELLHRVVRLEGEPPTVSAVHRLLLEGRDGDLAFTPDAVRAEDAVRLGQAAAALFLPPTTAARIRAVIDRREQLPQKSTFFWPKPRTGMVIQPLDDRA
ncbi:MAG TPA: DUF1015 domain-containing protein, partial [Actinomycetota bacterium]